MSTAGPDQAGWWVVAVVAVGLLALVAAIVVRRHRRPVSAHGTEARVDESLSGSPLPRAAVVVNPTKFDDLTAVRERVTKVCLDEGWAEPLWLETTAEDTGFGQTRQALEEGVDLVCPLGGDGTVRAVAQELVHTGTPLGLLPGGTGNLLARNLELPVDDLEKALRVALTGRDRTVDVGRIVVDVSGEDERGAEHVFLVMAGLGFDAEMMAGAPEHIKAKVGWFAYVVSGVRALRGAQAKVRVTVDDQPPYSRRVRTVVVGNVGKLTGGILLLPDAEVDDGWLDAVLLSPKGIVSWAVVAGRVLTRNRRSHPRVEHVRCRELVLESDRPQEAQLDGDTVGQARTLRLRVDPQALVVRVPARGAA